MRSLLTAFVLLFGILVCAQQPGPSAPVRFYSVSQAGLLHGEAGAAFQAQTVNGLRWGTWAAGLGVGFDNYEVRSIPLFIQVQKQLPLFDRSFSVYLDGGVHLPTQTQLADVFSPDYQTGTYLDAGLQYHWRIGKKLGPVFSVGYTEKRYYWEETRGVWCLLPPCGTYQSRWDIINRRLSVKAGIRL